MTTLKKGLLPYSLRPLVYLASATLPLTLFADEQPAQTIVVTANKVEQSLESTNANVKVALEDELETKGVKKVSDLSRVFSELSINARGNSAYSSITLRGISSPYYYSPNVLVYIDGVKQDAAFLDIPLTNVARVELLKGPQGALYGGNAYAGVINIITKGVSESAQLSLGTVQSNLYQRYTLNATSKKLKSGLYAGIDGSFNNNEGQIKDISTNEKDIDGSEEAYGKLTIGYAPNNSPLALELTASRDELDSNEEVYIRDDKLEDQEYESALVGPKGDLERTVNTYAFKASYNTDAYKITSITSYQDRSMDRTFLGLNSIEDQDTFSQEGRIEFDIAKASNLIGLYYENESFTREDSWYGPAKNDLSRESIALFGQSRYQFNETIDATVGARYDVTEASVDYNRTGAGAFSVENKETFKQLTPSISVGWQPSLNNRVYSTISRGYKPGGFNHAITSPTANAAYDSELSTNYELGWRTHLPAHDLKMATAVYLINAKDKQQYVGPLGLQYLSNLGDAQSYGLEFSLEWMATELLTLNTSVNIGKSELKDSGDYSGNSLPYNPETQANIAMNYIIPQNWFEFYVMFKASAHYASKSYFDEANTVSQPDYTLYNTSLDFMFDHVKLSLFVDNLTDEVIREYSFQSQGGLFSMAGDRRTVGINASFSM